MSTANLPTFSVISGKCLGHLVYRGFAPIHQIAEISQADIFDQDKNPNGTQRNLSRTHARKAYDYIATSARAFYPELVLNIRDASYIRFEPANEGTEFTTGILRFIRNPKQSQSIIVSRLDGNHRLWFTDGHEKSLPAIDRPIAFCFLVISDLYQELEIFRDINDNQMGMNTSHLQNIAARLLGEKSLKVQDPALYIVRRLKSDERSPFYNRINEGGAVKRGVTLGGLSVANLKNAIQDMLSRSAKLPQFPDADAQYEVIKNYWLAVRDWVPDAWDNPTKYILFKGVGLYAITYLGIEIIDRCLLKSKFASSDMLEYLLKIPNQEIFLAKSGIPYAGRSGGRKIAGDLISNLEEEGEISLTKLQKMILGNDS